MIRTWLSDFTFTFHFHTLEKAMATHSSVLVGESQDGGAWWAAVYGAAQGWTWLKWLSSNVKLYMSEKKIPQNYSYSTYTKNIEHNSILISDNSSQHTHTQKANETYQLLCSNDLNTEDLILHIIIKVIYGAFLTHPSKKKYNLNLFKSFDMIFNL